MTYEEAADMRLDAVRSLVVHYIAEARSAVVHSAVLVEVVGDNSFLDEGKQSVVEEEDNVADAE